MQVPFVDLDSEIERRQGATISQIFGELGESAFRDIEHEVTREVAGMHDGIIAAGGGWMANARNRALLPFGTRIIYLRASSATIAARLGSAACTRPLLDGDVVSALERLGSVRELQYAHANVAVDTESLTAQQVATHLRELIAPSS